MQRFLLCTNIRPLIPNGCEPEPAGARQLFDRLVLHTDQAGHGKIFYRDRNFYQRFIDTWND